MLHLLVVYLHLLATCAALGAILVSDLRLLGKAWNTGARLVPPEPFVARLVTVSLAVLIATGGALVALGLQADPGYLRNGKLQAKLVLVALLVLNAGVLHGVTFPRLATGRPLRLAGVADALAVAVPVALSNSLWLFCAFLGVARRWNHVVPIGEVLALAAAAFGVALLGAVVLLALTERRSPGRAREAGGAHFVPKMRSPASPSPGTM
ncbi:MAG TPA: hypothetical protein VFZ93_05725 [Albitalea sp.]